MMDDDNECEECESGAPAWMATFADLMSLLMCFFVLLLSFSEMDIQKYKQVAGSMKLAFGVQRDVKVEDIPKGTSVIKQEFTPGRPEPTPIQVMQQQLVEQTRDEVRTTAEMRQDLDELLQIVVRELEREIEEQVVEIEVLSDSILMRIREADSFPSGSAALQPAFLPVLDKVENVLEEELKGRIIVAGHTDNVPISTPNYPSNWVLSAARSASVVHYLSEVRTIDPSRMEIRAFADTQPVAENDTAENRSRNRRIEINISVPEELN